MALSLNSAVGWLQRWVNDWFVSKFGAQVMQGPLTVEGALRVEGLLTVAGDFLAVEAHYEPFVTASGTPPTTIARGPTNDGYYTKLGDLVLFNAWVAISSFTLGPGTGNLQVSLPVAASSLDAKRGWATVVTDGLNLPGTPAGLGFLPTAGAALGIIYTVRDDNTIFPVAIADLAAGDRIFITGHYWTD